MTVGTLPLATASAPPLQRTHAVASRAAILTAQPRQLSTSARTTATALSLVAASSVHRRGRAARRKLRGTRALNPFQGAADAVFGKQKKTVIVTGASSGLGLSATKALASSGQWFVIMACRDFIKAAKAAAAAGLPKDSYQVLHCDLAANDSVRQFVDAFHATGRSLEALVCNAACYFPNADKSGIIVPGLFAGGGPRWSADGHEMSFAANYLGHFLLCKLLLGDLERSPRGPARCVILGTVTATVNNQELGGQIPPLADLGDLSGLEQGMKSPVTMIDGKEFSGAKAYKDSKVCDVMLMRELHKRYHAKTGIVFSSMYPGCIAETNLFRDHYPVFQRLFPPFQKFVTGAYVSEEEAGRRLAACVADPNYATSGSYYSWQGKFGTGGAGGAEAKDNTEATRDVFMRVGSFRTLSVDEIGGEAGDDAKAKKLWELSEKLVEA
mmetsp:Transcript_28446/g.66250  ORF Transcript_28446/g.66250 Transcript_28446/m.66250 type:complete len:441 (+) Transcript_28446:85-1407(+)